MSDFAPIDRPPPRGPRTGAIIALFLIAFVAGLLLMAYAMRHWSWFGGTTTPSHAVTAAKTGGTPAPANDAARVAADPVSLATREAALAAQLAALETRLATITTDATTAGTQANRAESMLVAAATRRAIERGQPLGYLEEQLKTRFGATAPGAVSVLIATSRQPVTLETLRKDLDDLEPHLVVNDSDGWWEGMRQELGRLIVIRERSAPSSDPTERLNRVHKLLDSGMVEAARAEVARLPGAAAAQAWQHDAQRYALAHRALDVIENSALIASIAPPPIVTTPMSSSAPATSTEGQTAQGPATPATTASPATPASAPTI
ncbi:hypothetical protein [uncultured Sphingomonas sp.]|uniref:hypothetical protein n=1 Tax=uncultured Sphingomonas sp. TaxID=158754 RepID=UPI0025E1041C|nr:hypothetical protein [uncultured Sphingomonas sp.]